MPFLAAGPDITPIADLITTWIRIGQALVGSVVAPNAQLGRSEIGGLARPCRVAFLLTVCPPAPYSSRSEASSLQHPAPSLTDPPLAVTSAPRATFGPV
jgi:hypothetical protein